MLVYKKTNENRKFASLDSFQISVLQFWYETVFYFIVRHGVVGEYDLF